MEWLLDRGITNTGKLFIYFLLLHIQVRLPVVLSANNFNIYYKRIMIFVLDRLCTKY